MRVALSAHNVVNYPEGGGHFWVYLQYAHGLRRIGCDVWWLEEFVPTMDGDRDAARAKAFIERLAPYGFADRVILYCADGTFLNVAESSARSVFRTCDALLNFHQQIAPWMLGSFARTALVDIDPGLLQYWMSAGVLSVPRHDVYFTTGETVGRTAAAFPDCGIDWVRIRPPVALDLWPRADVPAGARFTTVSGWWGNDEWVDYAGEVYDNNKRAAFIRYVDLPRRVPDVPLELALYLDPDSEHDVRDRELFTRCGWSVVHSHDVAGTPDAYREYIRSSLGEFSCAKASCRKFSNAWVSDRTLCYLASGKPVVVEDTGPSAILPSGRGMFRFSTPADAAADLEEAIGNYAVHARAAREVAELFDARHVAEAIVSGLSRVPLGAQA